jgi:hypothetical protein
MRFWPWLVVLGFVVLYEAYAVITQYRARKGTGTARPTLSQLYWRAQRRWPPLRWILIVGLVLLAVHFTVPACIPASLR